MINFDSCSRRATRRFSSSIWFPEEILTYHKPRKPISKGSKGNITYVPVHAQAGFLDSFADQTKTEKYTTFTIPIFTEKDLFMISVEGDSMYPTITPGTFIIIKSLMADFRKNIQSLLRPKLFTTILR